jgi:hypothetical protein
MLSTTNTERMIPVLENLKLWFRQRKLQRAQRRNIENLALGADKMSRKPMIWGR